MTKNGYYQVLRIRTEATAEEIEAAFRREKREYEREGRAFKGARAMELTEAYEVLSDETRRRAYDEEQNRPVMTMDQLEEKVEREHVRTNFDRLIDDFVENPLREVLYFIFLLILVLISKRLLG